MMSKLHKKDVTDEEINKAMEPVFKEIERFLVPRIRPHTKTEGKSINKVNNKIKQAKKNKFDFKAITEQEMELLTNIFEEPNKGITARAARLGLSSYKMNQTKAALIKKCLAEQFTINLGKDFGGAVSLLELTENGYKAIKKTQKAKKPDNVSREHWWWQIAIYEHYRKKALQLRLKNQKKEKGPTLAFSGKGKK